MQTKTKGTKTMGKIKYKTRQVACKQCKAKTTGYSFINLKTKVTSGKVYCKACSVELTSKTQRPPIELGEINWCDAFNKFGYEDGDGKVWTSTVADYLQSIGYEVEYEGWGMHNTVITKLVDSNGKHIISDDYDLNKFVLGYDDPRKYLPKGLIEKLDTEFGEAQF
jgi:hypothetical protein